MADIENLIEFAQNGEKDITGLNQTNGFPAALKPARQWFNYLFNAMTIKINEIVGQVNNNSTAIEGISNVLTGTTILWCSDIIPNGYLELAGQEISRTTYSGLYALFGSTYGNGNGSTTFNLPDTRGEFIRGWDHGRLVDNGRLLGSHQDDTIQNITGVIRADSTNSGNTQFVDNLQAFGAFGVIPGDKTFTGDNSGGTGQAWGADFDASRVVRTSHETRGRNIALVFIIKT